MDKLYVLVFAEYGMLIDFKIFKQLDEALKEYIGYSTQETRKLLIDESLADSDKELEKETDSDTGDDEVEKISDDGDEDITCKLQFFGISNDSYEFVVEKEFDIDFFLENVVNDKEELKEYLEKLEDIVCGDDPVPNDIVELFTK